jgi:hypothetical protein
MVAHGPPALQTALDANATTSRTNTATIIVAAVFRELRVRIASFIFSPFARTDATHTTMALEDQ